MFQIYKDRNEYCRYCGDRAKAYYQNTPVCHYHYKKQIENESEEKKIKKNMVQQPLGYKRNNNPRSVDCKFKKRKISKKKADKFSSIE